MEDSSNLFRDFTNLSAVKYIAVACQIQYECITNDGYTVILYVISYEDDLYISSKPWHLLMNVVCRLICVVVVLKQYPRASTHCHDLKPNLGCKMQKVMFEVTVLSYVRMAERLRHRTCYPITVLKVGRLAWVRIPLLTKFLQSSFRQI